MSSRFRQYDDTLGVSLVPNMNVVHSRGCFQGLVNTNEWGMRDRSRSLSSASLRIALLGDSMLEGVHVKPSEVMNIQVEDILSSMGKHDVDVLNFGIAGIGTTQEFLVYETRAAKFKPDVVVLLFLTGNDVLNNSQSIQTQMYGLHTWYAPYYVRDTNGKFRLVPVASRPFHNLRLVFEQHSKLFYYLERIWDRVQLPAFLSSDPDLGWQVFSNSPNPEWNEAWAATEESLIRLNAAVRRDGGQFLVLVLPEFFDYDPDWRQTAKARFGENLPQWVRPESASERLREIASRTGISLEFLAPYAQAYRDAHDLKWPYLSLTCDSHLSALGHRVIAEAIVDKLRQRNILPIKREVSDARHPFGSFSSP